LAEKRKIMNSRMISLGMVDEQYLPQIIKDLREELDKAFKDNSLIMEVNVKLRREIRMLEKLLELNMKDLHDIADQRDWYYDEYQKLKDKLKA
jgi:hypothetical protein